MLKVARCYCLLLLLGLPGAHAATKTLCQWLVQKYDAPDFPDRVLLRLGSNDDIAVARHLAQVLTKRLQSLGPIPTENSLNPYSSYLIGDAQPGRFLLAPRQGLRARDPEAIHQDEIRIMIKLPSDAESSIWARLSDEGRELLARYLAAGFRKGCYDPRLSVNGTPPQRRLIRHALSKMRRELLPTGVENVGFSWSRVLRGALAGQVIGVCRLANSSLIGALLALGAPPEDLRLVRRQYVSSTPGDSRHIVVWVRGSSSRPWLKLDATAKGTEPRLRTMSVDQLVSSSYSARRASDDRDDDPMIDSEIIPIVVSPFRSIE